MGMHKCLHFQAVNLQYHLDQGNLKHRKVVKINNKCHMYTTYVIIQIEISMLRKTILRSYVCFGL